MIRLEILKSQTNPPKRILSKKAWKDFGKASSRVLFSETSGIAKVGSAVLFSDGSKVPIIFRDPRADRTQVQYVDMGFNLDVKAKPLERGLYLVRARGENSKATPHLKVENRSSVTIFESHTVMRRGQVAVFANVSGRLAARLLKTQFPEVEFLDSDHIIMALTLE